MIIKLCLRCLGTGWVARRGKPVIYCAPPGPDRWKVRSKTFGGMAEAWADQRGGWAMGVAAVSFTVQHGNIDEGQP